eukprot:5948195-Pyramimonas_sp.AAC.1
MAVIRNILDCLTALVDFLGELMDAPRITTDAPSNPIDFLWIPMDVRNNSMHAQRKRMDCQGTLWIPKESDRFTKGS